jgi:hypothetical protein
MPMKMHESRTRSANVPSVGDDNIGPLVQVPENGPDGSPSQPMLVFLRNNGDPDVFVAHDVSSLRSLETLSEAFKVVKGDFMITVVAPGQRLLAASKPFNDGARGLISYTVFAMPFWMAGPTA